MIAQSQLKGAQSRTDAGKSLHSVKRSAKSGVAPSVPGSAEAGRATREAAKALAHETENPGPTTAPTQMHRTSQHCWCFPGAGGDK